MNQRNKKPHPSDPLPCSEGVKSLSACGSEVVLPKIFAPLALWLVLTAGFSKTEIAVASTLFNILETAEQVKVHQSYPQSLAERLTVLGTEIAATENTELALQLFDRSVQVTETIEDRATKINTLSAIALKLAEVEQTQRATQLFDRAVQLTKQTDENFTLYAQDPALRDVAIKVAQAGFTERALQLTETIASNYRKAEALNAIAPVLAEKGQLDRAKNILSEALQKARGITGDYVYESNGSCGNDKFDILAKIAGNLSLLSQVQKALEVAQSVTGCSSANGESGEDYQTWAYLGILAHLANAEQVKQTWTSAQTIQNNIEKAEVWSAIGVKLAALNETNLALSVASNISQQIPSITKIDYGSAMREFGVKEKALRDIAVKLAEVGQFEPAKQVAQTIRELTPEEVAANKYFNGGNKPSVKALTWVEIARQLAKAKQVEPALQIADSIGDGEGKALAIIAIAQQLQKTGQTSQAEKILSQNLQLPEITNAEDYTANQSIGSIAVALGTVGQVDRALQIAQSIKNDTVKQEAIGNIASQLAEVGQLDRALQIANTINNAPGFQEDALSKIAIKFVELGQLDRALQVAQSLGDDTKDNILANIADAFAKLGQAEKALQVAQTIANKEMKATAIANIAARLIKSN